MSVRLCASTPRPANSSGRKPAVIIASALADKFGHLHKVRKVSENLAGVSKPILIGLDPSLCNSVFSVSRWWLAELNHHHKDTENTELHREGYHSTDMEDCGKKAAQCLHPRRIRTQHSHAASAYSTRP